jgi:hypothetical protein
MSALYRGTIRNAPFDAVPADTRQLERHEQAIEVLYQPAADERERPAGSPMQLGERSNQRCRHRDALGRCRDVEDGAVDIEQDCDLVSRESRRGKGGAVTK